MIEQRTQEWFSARRNRLTASSVGAVLGFDPFRNREDVMRSMVREYHGATNEFTGNVATEWGVYNEAGAIAEFEMETGLKVNKCGFYPYEDWLGASPDGLIGDSWIIENKCPFGKRKDVNPEFKSLLDQPNYYAQVQIQLLCTSRYRAYFNQWTPYGTKTEDIGVDKIWRDTNLPILRQFYTEYLSERDNPDHLAPRRISVDTPEAHKAIQEWDELKEQIELAQERQKDLLAEIVAMGKDQDALIAGRKLTKVERAGSVSYAKALKSVAPELDLTPWTGKPSEYWKLT